MTTGRSPSILAVALVAFCAVLACGEAPAAERAAPHPTAGALERIADKRPPAPAPLITGQQLADINKFIDKHGRKAVIDPDLSQDLKLSKDSAPVTADQVSLLDKNDPKGRHLLYRLSDSPGYLLVRQKSDLRALYHLGNDLKLIEGVRLQPGKRQKLTVAQTRQEMHNELATWAAVARQDK